MGWLKPYLTPTQLERLKEHRYCSEGSSLFEVFMQPYWRWLVTKVPLWVAPNTITMAGIVCAILQRGGQREVDSGCVRLYSNHKINNYNNNIIIVDDGCMWCSAVTTVL